MSKMSPEVKIEKLEKERVISDKLTELRFAVDKTLMEKLTRLKSLLAHSDPGIGLAELVGLMADKTIETVEKKRFSASLDNGKTRPDKSIDAAAQCRIGGGGDNYSNPPIPERKKKSSAHSKKRRAPAAIRRKIFLAAKGRYEKCGSQHAVEFDHRIPFAVGGESAAENLRLLCRSCNQRAAIRFFGKSP